jgi:hypothetical protein
MTLATALGWSLLPPAAEAGICRWKDASGVHYSDNPPPGVQCEGTVKAPVTSPTPSTAPAGAGKDYQAQDLEFKQRRLEKDEAAKKAAQERQQAEERQRACAEWKARAVGLKTGGRVVRYGADGERAFLSDEEIGRELANAERQAAEWCK